MMTRLAAALAFALLGLPGLPASAQSPCGALLTHTRAGIGRATPDPIRWERRYRYDRRGRLTEVRHRRLDPAAGPDLSVDRFRYGRHGLMTAMSVNGRRMVVTRDAHGVITALRLGSDTSTWHEMRFEWEGEVPPVEPRVDYNTLIVFGWNNTLLDRHTALLFQGGREGTARGVRYACERPRRGRPTCTPDPLPDQPSMELVYDASGRLVRTLHVSLTRRSTRTYEWEHDLPQVTEHDVRLVDGRPVGAPREREIRFEHTEDGIANAPTIGRLERDERGRIVRRGGDTEYRYQCRR